MEGDALQGSDSMFYFKAAPGPSPSPRPGPSQGGGRGAGSGVPAGEGEKEQDQGTVWGEQRASRGKQGLAGRRPAMGRPADLHLHARGMHSSASGTAYARRLLPQCRRSGAVQLPLQHLGALAPVSHAHLPLCPPAGALASRDEQHGSFRRAMEEAAAEASSRRYANDLKQAAGGRQHLPAEVTEPPRALPPAATTGKEEAPAAADVDAGDGQCQHPYQGGILSSLRRRQGERQEAERSLERLVERLHPKRWGRQGMVLVERPHAVEWQQASADCMPCISRMVHCTLAHAPSAGAVLPKHRRLQWLCLDMAPAPALLQHRPPPSPASAQGPWRPGATPCGPRHRDSHGQASASCSRTGQAHRHCACPAASLRLKEGGAATLCNRSTRRRSWLGCSHARA